MSAPLGRASTPSCERPTSPSVLPPNVITEAVNRLSKARAPSAPLGPLHPRHALPPEKVAEAVTRLHTAAIQRKVTARAEVAKKVLVDRRPHVVLSPEDELESVSRLYYNSVKSKQQKLEELSKKFLAPIIKKGADPEARAKVEHSIVHLHSEEKDRRRERDRLLFTKYIQATEPKSKKLDHEEIAGIVERLCTPTTRVK